MYFLHNFCTVYCRSAPAEYATFTPDADVGIDFFTLRYPAACKSAGQNVAVFSVRSLAAAASSTGTKKFETSSVSKSSPVGRRAASPKPDVGRTLTPPRVTTDNDLQQRMKGQHESITATTEVLMATPAGPPRPNQGLSGTDSSVDFLLRNYADRNWAPKPHANFATRSPVRGEITAPISVVSMTSALSPASQSAASPVPAVAVVNEEMNTPPRSRRRRRNKVKSVRSSRFGQVAGKQQQQQKGVGSTGGSDDDDDDSDDDDDDDVWQTGNDNSFARAVRTPTSPGGKTSNSRQRKKKLVPPILLLEFKAFGECLSTVATVADSRLYAATISLSSLAASYGMDVQSAEEQLYVCAAPLYEWHLLTEQTLQSFNVKWMSLHTEFSTLDKVKDELSQSLGGSPMPQFLSSPGTPAVVSLFGPSATFQPSRRKKMIDPKLPGAKRTSLLNIVPLDADGKPTSAFAREDPMVAMRKAIEIRKEIISANDRICADYNNQRERTKLETWNDQYLSSPTSPLSPAQKLSRNLPLPTIGSSPLSTIESSPLPRHAVNKQHLKLLESLLSSPTRSVEPRIRLAL